MLSAGGDEAGESIARHVVVIEVERASRNAVRRSEGVQLIQIGVGDQVCPQPAVRGPARVIDKDRHPSIVRTRDTPGARFCPLPRHPVE